MNKTRVKKGEKYWYINTNAAITAMWADWDMEGNYPSIDTTRFENGNYFQTCAEAEVMARKLRAVLKGADVIEMPSEEDIKERLNMIIPTQPVEPWCVEGYCKHMIDFVKSKIVK